MQVSQLPIWSRLRRSNASGQVDAGHAQWCRNHHLIQPENFLALAGEVVSGHRDRHVVEVRFGGKRLFLKKEHRVAFRTRVRNAWDGFGPVSLSEREAITLTRLQDAGVPVPQWIACGADGKGRAFVLLRNARGKDLRTVLARGSHDFCRWRLAHAIGVAIGRMHQAGFDAPDLSAKHVLVRRDGSVVLIDWPRAIERSTLNCNRCLAALAGLHASLAPQLANMRDRLAVLKVWMRTIGFHGPAAPLARQVIRIAANLSHRRSIREQLVPNREQRLRWIDGESLCVSRRYWRSLKGHIPDWLRHAANSVVPWRTSEIKNSEASQNSHSLHEESSVLTCFPPVTRMRRLLAWLCRRPVQSVGIRQAGLAYRLARHKVPVAPVLAFGGRKDGGGFLLTGVSEKTRPARAWLAFPRPGRRTMLRGIGRVLRKCHDAGCRGVTATNLAIDTTMRPRLRIVPNGDLYSASPLRERQITTDIKRLSRELGLISRRDVLRVIRGYFGTEVIRSKSLRIVAESLNLTARRAA